MNLAAGAFPKPQVLPARWAPADHPPPGKEEGWGRIRTDHRPRHPPLNPSPSLIAGP